MKPKEDTARPLEYESPDRLSRRDYFDLVHDTVIWAFILILLALLVWLELK